VAAHLQLSPSAQPQDALYNFLRGLGLDPGHLYQELEMTSPFVDTHRDTSYSNAVVQLHSHSFYEIIFCRSTCGAEYLVGAERYRLQKGDVILIPPGVSHRPLLPEILAEPYIRDVVWISPEMVESIGHFLPPLGTARQNLGSLLRTAGTKWEYIGDLFHSGLLESESRAPGWELALIGNTLSLTTHLKRAFLDEATVPMAAEKPELPDQAMAYIEANLSHRITLEDAAQQLYVSASTLSQTFRKKMGVSFYRCVTQRRLIAAKALISEGHPLEEVGRQVGFSDYSGFYRAFKQEYGISPCQYRKLQESSAGVLYPPAH